MDEQARLVFIEFQLTSLSRIKTRIIYEPRFVTKPRPSYYYLILFSCGAPDGNGGPEIMRGVSLTVSWGRVHSGTFRV